MSDESEELVRDIIAYLDADIVSLDLFDYSEHVKSQIQNWTTAHPGFEVPIEAIWEFSSTYMMAVPRSRRKDTSKEPFQPMEKWINRDTDPPTTVEYPDVVGLLKDDRATAYYRNRADTTSNSVLKARYADLAWTAMKKRHAPDAYRYGLDAADAYLEQTPLCVKQQAHIELVDNLDRAAEIALEMNNRDLANRIVVFAIDSLEQMAVAERARWVLDLGDILLYIASKYRDLPGVEAWKRIREICDEGIGHYETEDHENPFLAQNLMQLATQIAERQEDSSTAWNYQLRIAESFYALSKRREMDGGTTGGKLVACKFMEDAIHYYQRLVSLAPSSTERDRLRSRVEDARREVRRLLREGEAEMKPIGTSVDIPRETLEQMVAPLLEVEPEDVLELLSGDRSWLPDIADIQHRAKEAAGKYVYSTLFGRVTLRDGRKVDEIPAMQGETVHFFDYLNSWFQFHAQILNFILHRLKEEGRFSLETFMAHLRRWEFLEEPDATFIEVGLERYFTGDHISAIHVLTPRIEHMLKSAFEQAGIVPIVVPDQRHIREQTFGDFLRRDEVRQVLGEDLWHYLNYAFVDERGLNIRNDIAHGWIQPPACNQALIQIVLFAILLLTRIRRVEQPEGEAEDTDATDAAANETAEDPRANPLS